MYVKNVWKMKNVESYENIVNLSKLVNFFHYYWPYGIMYFTIEIKNNSALFDN